MTPRLMLLKALLLALALVLAPTLHAQQAVQPPASPSAPVRHASVEGITEYRLPNGLRILLAPDASKPSTTVNVTYLVGSRMEHYGETGMAHLLEHLLFKGTPSLPGKTIVQEFGRRGMQFNGTTADDRTNYYETFPASDDHLEWALKMEADRMVNAFIAKEDLDSEMTVVRNEMERGENSPLRILLERMLSSAYQWHNYGNSTIGARSDVENVSIERLRAFYRHYYQPDNAVLIVTGKFDEARTLGWISQYFGSIPKPGRVIEPTYTRDPVQDGAREVTLQRVGDTQWLATLYHIAPGAHPDFAAIEILAQILGDTPRGRLHRALVDKKLATAVFAWPADQKDPGTLLFGAQLDKRQSPEAARKVLLETVEHLARQPLTAAELARAKAAILNEYEKSLADPARFGVELSEAVAVGDWRLFFLKRDRIEQITLAQVQQAAENYFKPSNRTLGQFVPTDKPDRVRMPDAPDIAAMVGNYTGKAAISAGEVFDVSPAHIDQRTQTHTLANGMQLALLPKTTRGQRVNGVYTLRMGDEHSLAGKRGHTALVAAMLERGSRRWSRSEIADQLEAMNASLAFDAQEGSLSVQFETRRDQLPKLMALLRELLQYPAFPEAEWAQLQAQAIASLEEGMRQPQSVALNALLRHGNPYPKTDPRYAATPEEDIATLRKLKRGDLQTFHARFFGTGNAQLALVGDFDAAALHRQAQSLFGQWRAAQAYRRIPKPALNLQPTRLQLNTPDKPNANYFARRVLPVRDDHPDYPALLLAERILGGGGMKSRLADRLRQKEGISYGVGSQMSVNAVDARADVLLYASFAPQYLPRVETAIREVLARLMSDGVSAEELQEAKAGVLEENKIARGEDASLAAALNVHLVLGRTMGFVAAQEERLKAVTQDAVNAAIRTYLQADQWVQVYAGDFAKTAAQKPE